jgi:divalent metal cation (Fe/Co/Zn/Cd) transporter
MAGLIVAFLGVWLGQVTGNPYFDGGASVVIGLILAATAIWLAWETKSLLIGEAAEPELVASVRARADELPEVVAVNEVLTLHMGPEYVLVNMTVDFADEVSAGRLEEAIAALDAQIREAHPRVKRVFIEAEASKQLARAAGDALPSGAATS